MIIWNPWHGCHEIRAGYRHCRMHFIDAHRGIDTSRVFRRKNFVIPLAYNPDGAVCDT